MGYIGGILVLVVGERRGLLGFPPRRPDSADSKEEHVKESDRDGRYEAPSEMRVIQDSKLLI